MDAYVVIAFLALSIYLALAVHVVTHNPRQLISWLFAGFCSIFFILYMTNLFLLPHRFELTKSVETALRIKWMCPSIGAVLYFHIAVHYFPKTWQIFTRLLLLVFYPLGAVFALASAFTDQIISGAYYRTATEIIGPTTGPLLVPLAVFFGVLVLYATAGLIAGYRKVHSPSLQHQIILFLVPTLLTIGVSLLNWYFIFAGLKTKVPNEAGDVVTIIAGILYGVAVTQYGSFTGFPVALRRIAYTLLWIFLFLLLLYPAVLVDQYLLVTESFPIPLTTGLLLVFVAAAFPAFRKASIRFFTSHFFRSKPTRLSFLDEVDIESIEPAFPHGVEGELLVTLASVLRSRGGYLAFHKEGISHGWAVVQSVYGVINVAVGDVVPMPPAPGLEPQLVSSLPPDMLNNPGYQHLALFCRVHNQEGGEGFLALTAKEKGRPFTNVDLALCGVFAIQIGAASQLHQLEKQRDSLLETARQKELARRVLEEKLLFSTMQTLTSYREAPLPLEVRILGPLQVLVEGELVPESAWGSEKAKDLLVYLLWKGADGASRGELCLALWPDHPEDKVANVFHVTINRLRSVLEPKLVKPRSSQYIIHERGKYWFNVNAPHLLDGRTFKALVSAGDAESLKKAISLYRGPYMVDSAWVLPAEVEVERRLLEQMCERVLRRLAEQAEDEEKELIYKKILLLNPSDEKIHQALLERYLAHGRMDLVREQLQQWESIQSQSSYGQIEMIQGFRKKIRESENSNLN